MKKFVKVLISLSLIMVVLGCFFSTEASAAGKKKKGGLTPEEMTQITDDVNFLTRKVYARSLFSSAENEKLINIKLMLDNAMMTTPNPEFAPLYFKAGNIYKAREYKDEAIECYQTILENFGDTLFAPKARNELLKMGIKVEQAIETEPEN